MNGDTDKLDDFQRARTSFREHMKSLWQKKSSLFMLFRKKLEAEKLHEIQEKLHSVNDPLSTNNHS